MNRSKKINCLSVACAIVFVVFLGLWSFNILFPMKYKSIIEKYAELENLSPVLIASIIKTESGFDSTAVSKKGAVGLMQIMPQTAKWIYENNFEDEFDEQVLFDPEMNICVGVLYVSYLFEKYQDEITALACYNAGEGVVKEWMGECMTLEKTQIEYKETAKYVSKVQNAKKIYKFRI